MCKTCGRPVLMPGECLGCELDQVRAALKASEAELERLRLGGARVRGKVIGKTLDVLDGVWLAIRTLASDGEMSVALPPGDARRFELGDQVLVSVEATPPEDGTS